MKVKSAEFKNKFLSQVTVQGVTADCNVEGRVVCEVEMVRNWFRNIFVIYLLVHLLTRIGPHSIATPFTV